MKFKIILIIFFLFYGAYVFADKEVHAHYMGLFESKSDDPSAPNWGVHWPGDKGHAHPDNINPVTGQRDIASVHYPLIGPYDSGDFKSLEYHILLAQSCGIRGFVIDYYGTNDYSDHRITKESFEVLASNVLYLNALNNNEFVYSNFKISIAYDEGALNGYSDSYITHASNDIEYIKNNYADNSYYYTNQDTGKPFLMIWAYWTKISNPNWISLLNEFTNFFAIDMIANPGEETFASHFPWVKDDKWTSNSSPDPYLWGESYLNTFYSNMGNNTFIRFATGGIWPGFDEKGWLGDTRRLMYRQDGQVYKNTWQKVFNYLSTYPTPLMNLVQIITWNDWGEATEIEPSVEYGYDYIHKTRNQINFYTTPILINDMALLVPHYIYNARLSVAQSLVSQSNSSIITNAIQNFYKGDYYSALTNATKAMDIEIPEVVRFKRGNQNVLVKWNKISTASGYKVYVSTENDYISMFKESNATVVADADTTSIVIPGMDNSKNYYCAVSSYIGEKNNETRFKIEGWLSSFAQLDDDTSISPVLNFKAEKYNNQIKLSWITPDDNDYYSTYICFMSSSRYPNDPSEGVKVIQITNEKNTYTEYLFKSLKAGYKYFSAFAMDQAGNISSPALASIFIIDKPVKLAGNFIIPAEGNKHTLIYIDTEKSNQKVKIKIYNLKGKLIKDFGEKQLSVGRNQYIWPENEEELNEIPSGVYILSVTGDIEQKEKIVVVK